MKIPRKLRKLFSGDRREVVVLCPRCGSPRIRLASRFSGWLTPRVYVCEKCGYTGPVYLEVDLEDYVKKFKPESSRE